jgi:hypothetical protein
MFYPVSAIWIYSLAVPKLLNLKTFFLSGLEFRTQHKRL